MDGLTTTVTALAAVTEVNTDDVFYIVEDPAGVNISRKCTGAQIATMVSGIHQLETDPHTMYALADGSRGDANVPAGGATGSIIVKLSATDYDLDWVDLQTAVTEIAIDGGYF